MRNVLVIARKEMQEALRNRWFVATTLLLAMLALTLTFLGSAPTGNVGVEPLDVVIVSLSSLSIFLLPLLALLISHDAIVGEIERGTMLLLLSYPVARWQVPAGKIVGQFVILAFATIVGFGAAVAALLLTGAPMGRGSVAAFAALVGSSVLLGAAFAGIGLLISALTKQRGAAAGIALGVWLAFVLLYDMALLGVLVIDQGRTIGGPLLTALLLANPTDVYRIYNLAGSAGAGALSGMAGLSATAGLSPPVLIGALLAWTAAPLVLAVLVFSRREI